METKNYSIENARVLKVMMPTNEDSRISIVLDKQFKTIDMMSGEEKDTNILGLNIYNAVNQFSLFIPEIQLADALAMGKPVNPKIVSLCLMNATLTIDREFKKQGEARQNEGVYSNDCYITTVKKCKPNILPVFKTQLEKLLNEEPALIRQTGTVSIFDF